MFQNNQIFRDPNIQFTTIITYANPNKSLILLSKIKKYKLMHHIMQTIWTALQDLSKYLGILNLYTFYSKMLKINNKKNRKNMWIFLSIKTNYQYYPIWTMANKRLI